MYRLSRTYVNPQSVFSHHGYASKRALLEACEETNALLIEYATKRAT
jgi:hypothetical protein